MDHLPSLEHKHIQVPFLIEPRIFQPQEFFNLLDSEEAGPQLLKNGPPPKMLSSQCNEFFQRLLFFSLLAEFTGEPVDAARFIEPDIPLPWLSTRNALKPLLRKWEDKMDPESPHYAQETQRQVRIALALSEARAFVSKWCSDKRTKKPKKAKAS